MLFLDCNFTTTTIESLIFAFLLFFPQMEPLLPTCQSHMRDWNSKLWKTTGIFQIITMAYRENCLGKLAQHSPVLFILLACWFCYCLSYCLIYSNELRHLQRCLKSLWLPTTEKQFVCIFLIQIKIYFLWFLKGYDIACSIFKIFYPNSVAVAMLVFQPRLLGEEEKKHFFIGLGPKNTSIS